MEAISNNENGPVRRAYARSGDASSSVPAPASEVPTDAKLTDLSKIADRASQSGDEVRPEAIERAKALLADPNWPNDTAIEGLAEKLLSSGDFAS
tara:strand:- start:378 stop:662 length:285 start_codon:yes stop_codon:yes gene_type:complete